MRWLGIGVLVAAVVLAWAVHRTPVPQEPKEELPQRARKAGL